jgi:hypothetical protein
MDTCELTLTDLLADPMTLAVMAADRVDPAALVAALSGLARRLEFARPRCCLRRTRRKRFSRILYAQSNERLPTRCGWGNDD